MFVKQWDKRDVHRTMVDFDSVWPCNKVYKMPFLLSKVVTKKRSEIEKDEAPLGLYDVVMKGKSFDKFLLRWSCRVVGSSVYERIFRTGWLA